MDKLITLFSKNGNRAFWDNSSFRWITRMEAAWGTIRNEIDRVILERDHIPGLGEVSEDANLGADGKPLSRPHEWKWFFLHAYGHRIDDNCIRCPKTTELVESIPGMRCAMFTILAPGKHVPPHRGLYKGLLRYHLGVRIPGPGFCRIKVAGETRLWEEGRSFVFDDTCLHEVWNESDVHRVVLILDVERPLNLPLAALNRLILRWISSTVYVTDGVRRVRSVHNAPRAARSVSAATANRQGTM